MNNRYQKENNNLFRTQNVIKNKNNNQKKDFNLFKMKSFEKNILNTKFLQEEISSNFSKDKNITKIKLKTLRFKNPVVEQNKNIMRINSNVELNKNLLSYKKSINKIQIKNNVEDIYDMNFIPLYEEYYPCDYREIICLHIGQAFLEIGSSCWELFCLEHGIRPDGVYPKLIRGEDDNYCFTTFFNETANGRFVPRSIFIDSDPTLINEIKEGCYKYLFRKEQFIFGYEQSSKLYSSRYSPNGKEIIKISLDRINHLLEYCDNPQGFLIFNSIGGGTGSGLGSLLLEELSDNNSKKYKFCFPIYPSTHNDILSIEKFNSVLSIISSLKHSNIDFIFQNDAINEICRQKFNIIKPSYYNINRLIAQVISSITCPLRYDDKNDISQFISCLIPFPKLHFLLSSYAPLCSSEIVPFENFSVAQITNETFYKNSIFANCNEKENRFITSCLMYRGYIISKEIIGAIEAIKGRYKIKFSDWCKTGFKSIINYNPIVPGDFFPKLTRSICRISNNSGINNIFEGLKESYN